MTSVDRVLQIIGTMNRGGAETFLMNLYRHFDRSRWQFDFVAFGESEGDFDKEIEALGGRVIRISGKNLLDYTWGLYRFLIRNPPYRIAHAHIGFSGVFFLLAARLARIPNRFLHSHNAVLKTGYFASVYRSISRKLVPAAATQRLACGKLAADEMFGTCGDVLIVPNCIDVRKFDHSSKSRDAIRSELGLSAGQKLILQIARVAPQKNHSFTLQLAEAAHKKGTWRFISVGEGPLEKWYVQEITKRGVQNRLRHIGLRRDVPALMGAADVLILPSHYEGFPVVLVEAQAAGLPCVVANNIDPDVELGLGLLKFVPGFSTNDWIEAIVEALELPRPSFEARSRTLSEAGFNAATSADRLAERYTAAK